MNGAAGGGQEDEKFEVLHEKGAGSGVAAGDAARRGHVAGEIPSAPIPRTIHRNANAAGGRTLAQCSLGL